jgi:hypothetical protein
MDVRNVRLVISVCGGKAEVESEGVDWQYLDSFSITLSAEQSYKIRHCKKYPYSEVTVDEVHLNG